MDVFCEYIVSKKKTLPDYLLNFAILWAAIVLTFLFIILLPFTSIGLLLVFGCWWGAFRLIKGRSIEYEYILTNSELDIDKIVAKSRRKRVCSVDFKEIELCASISDSAFANVYSNSGERKVQNFAGDIKADNVYFVDYLDEAQQMRIIFQPSKRMLDSIKKANMRFVNVKEGDL